MSHAIGSKGLADKRIQMPEDFKRHTYERRIPMSRGRAWSIADMIENLHDRGRGRIKLILEEDLRFLSMKGTAYVRAYYSHFILDYLASKKGRHLLKMLR